MSFCILRIRLWLALVLAAIIIIPIKGLIGIIIPIARTINVCVLNSEIWTIIGIWELESKIGISAFWNSGIEIQNWNVEFWNSECGMQNSGIRTGIWNVEWGIPELESESESELNFFLFFNEVVLEVLGAD